MDSLMWTGYQADAWRFGARLAQELDKRGIQADLNGDHHRTAVSLCHGLVATVDVTADSPLVYWPSPRARSSGRRLCRIRHTVDGAAGALVADYRLLNGPDEPIQTTGPAHATSS
ncbi:hypothetical protein [Spongiactinospora sp. TRM90649]|uniref:hypothetical protein n=1 Tax=Spongiactinospora sp. TRM90649 TaxID=3031114 RepID=UPI0023F8DB2B|nr:hypothetical protein [Spongiactinospora sp. TRM90649]MDF5758408.1 hypothetical protein [Spongiactinospora sp. TRM90649]